jgi:hypothetical protein
MIGVADTEALPEESRRRGRDSVGGWDRMNRDFFVFGGIMVMVSIRLSTEAGTNGGQNQTQIDLSWIVGFQATLIEER